MCNVLCILGFVLLLVSRDGGVCWPTDAVVHARLGDFLLALQRAGT